MSDIAVDRVIIEKVLLLLPSILHRHIRNDILLTSVDDTNEAELERIRATCQDIESVRAGIHEVELCQHAERSQTPRVNRTSELERIRVGKINVRRRNSKNHPDVSIPKNRGNATHEFGLEM